MATKAGKALKCKPCKRCQQDKPDDFDHFPKKLGGRRYLFVTTDVCKECKRAAQREAMKKVWSQRRGY